MKTNQEVDEILKAAKSDIEKVLVKYEVRLRSKFSYDVYVEIHIGGEFSKLKIDNDPF